MGCPPIWLSVGSRYCAAGIPRRNVQLELYCFSLALPSFFPPLSSVPTPSCVLENRVRLVIFFRDQDSSSAPLAQTSTCRSSSSFLSSKYLFRPMVSVKRSMMAETETEGDVFNDKV